MRWTRASLKAACWRALRRPDFRFTTDNLADCRAKMVPKHATVDPYQVGLIPGAVHELIHAVLDPQLTAVFNHRERLPSLWEAVIDTLELVIAEGILNDAEETERWRRAIDAKLGSARKSGAS